MNKILIPFLLSTAFLFGCNPDNSSGLHEPQFENPLVQRPSSEPTSIFARDLQFQNDDRISYCEVLATEKNSYSGYRDQKKYPLASLSKVITTAWLLKKLGPDHTFTSTWFYKPVSGQPGVFDAYLQTNYDPVFNIEKILYSLSILHNSGVNRIRNLIVDETTRIYLSALSQPHVELEQVPISSLDSIQNLKLILNSENWSSQTVAAKQHLRSWAEAHNKSLNLPQQFSVEHIELQLAHNIDRNAYAEKVEIKSSSLLKYIKNLNVHSNNYISDFLFWYLGGAAEFQKFQNDNLQLSEQELQFFTGSGLADNSASVRKDNLGSCTAVLKVLNFLDQFANKNQLNLGHFLYNPTQDLDGTFEANLNFSNQIVIKTGRLFENPALNLAGIVSTEKGSLYFAFLGHNFFAEDSTEIEFARDQLVRSALKYYPTKNSFLTLDDFEIFLP